MKRMIQVLVIGAALYHMVATAQQQQMQVGTEGAEGADDVLGLEEAPLVAAGHVSRAAHPAPVGGSALVPGARFTLKQELAARIHDPLALTNNRTSFRVEYQKHFLGNFYLHADVMGTAFWKRDHRAKARTAGGEVFTESTIREAYLQFSKADTSIKVGRQMLIWGDSDAGAITDVISPRNFSELLFISLEEARISQFMVTLDQFTPVGDWSLFYIPSARFNRYPEAGTAYYLDPFAGGARTRTPERAMREFGVRWKKTFGNRDIGLMAARLVDNDRAMRLEGLAADGSLRIVNEARRFDMLGMTANVAMNGILFSAEVARKSPRALLDPVSLQTVERDGIDTSLRVEYSLGGNHSVSLEGVNRHLRGWNASLAPTPRNANSVVLGWSNTFLKDNLSANWLTVYNQTHTGYQHSLFMSYKWNSRVNVSLDAFYLSVKERDNELYPYRGQNSAVFRVIYQF